jgi:hypothetical protein
MITWRITDAIINPALIGFCRKIIGSPRENTVARRGVSRKEDLLPQCIMVAKGFEIELY